MYESRSDKSGLGFPGIVSRLVYSTHDRCRGPGGTSSPLDDALDFELMIQSSVEVRLWL